MNRLKSHRSIGLPSCNFPGVDLLRELPIVQETDPLPILATVEEDVPGTDVTMDKTGLDVGLLMCYPKSIPHDVSRYQTQ